MGEWYTNTLCSSADVWFDFLSALSLCFCQCCRFNYRSTHYLSTNGFYEFLNWFDERAWYPLGRIVGGTVSDPYAGVCVSSPWEEGEGLYNCGLGSVTKKSSLSLFLKNCVAIMSHSLKPTRAFLLILTYLTEHSCFCSHQNFSCRGNYAGCWKPILSLLLCELETAL